MQFSNDVQHNSQDRGRLVLSIIMIVSFVLPIPYFAIIQGLQLGGLLVYFMQLGLYLVLALLAVWGLRRHQIALPFSGGRLLKAVGWAVAGWAVFAILICLFGLANLPGEFSTLVSTPADSLLARIFMSWLVVGMVEELLFRGYLLPAFHRYLSWGTGNRRITVAIVLSSAFFSIWHLPIRFTWLVSGEIGPMLLVISLLVVFVEGLAFAYLYVRTNNILLVGLVHGLVDLPLVGASTQLSFVILLVCVAGAEAARWIAKRQSRAQEANTHV